MMSDNAKSAVTKALFNAIAQSSFERIVDWFKQNPSQKYCYWASDEFLPADCSEQDKQDFISRHSEIEDLSDHTTVYYDSSSGTVTLRTFCKRLRECIAAMLAEGYTSNVVGDISWRVEPEGNNYKVIGQHIK